jgi:hypothetical protein
MIYLVSGNLELFNSGLYEHITVEESLEILKQYKMIQFDSETTGRNPHINDFLCVQFGNIEGTEQIIVDTTTTNILLYKEYIENTYIIGQNLKFKYM